MTQRSTQRSGWSAACDLVRLSDARDLGFPAWSAAFTVGRLCTHLRTLAQLPPSMASDAAISLRVADMEVSGTQTFFGTQLRGLHAMFVLPFSWEAKSTTKTNKYVFGISLLFAVFKTKALSCCRFCTVA